MRLRLNKDGSVVVVLLILLFLFLFLFIFLLLLPLLVVFSYFFLFRLGEDLWNAFGSNAWWISVPAQAQSQRRGILDQRQSMNPRTETENIVDDAKWCYLSRPIRFLIEFVILGSRCIVLFCSFLSEMTELESWHWIVDFPLSVLNLLGNGHSNREALMRRPTDRAGT